MNNIWDTFEIKSGSTFTWECSSSILDFDFDGMELKAAYRFKQEKLPDPVWTRYPVQGDNLKIRINPFFPSEPFLVKPDNLIIMRAGSVSKVYVRLPLWIYVEILSDKPIEITSEPSVKLSKTWLGSFTEGELCFSIGSSTKNIHLPDPERNNMAICPVNIINASNTDRIIKKICLRSKYLSLYHKDSQLYTDRMDIKFRSADQESLIDVEGKAPEEAADAILVKNPAEGGGKNLISKSFHTLVTWTASSISLRK